MGNKTRTYMNEFHPVLSGTCLPISAYPLLVNNSYPLLLVSNKYDY